MLPRMSDAGLFSDEVKESLFDYRSSGTSVLQVDIAPINAAIPRLCVYDIDILWRLVVVNQGDVAN